MYKSSYTIPYVIEDTGRGERAMDIYSRLLKDRIIFIGTEISDPVANTVIAQLLFLRAEDHKKPVSIYINSPGGQITAGLAIYDTMDYMNFEINTYCIGMSGSMATLILMAGTKGRRIALKHSRIMIHQPDDMLLYGDCSDMNLLAREALSRKHTCGEIMAQRTGKGVDEVLKASERVRYMSPEEALSFNIVDKIAEKNPLEKNI